MGKSICFYFIIQNSFFFLTALCFLVLYMLLHPRLCFNFFSVCYKFYKGVELWNTACYSSERTKRWVTTHGAWHTHSLGPLYQYKYLGPSHTCLTSHRGQQVCFLKIGCSNTPTPSIKLCKQQVSLCPQILLSPPPPQPHSEKHWNTS